MVELQGYKVNSISFENNVEDGAELELQNKFQYNVNYADEESRCIGKLNFRVIDSELQGFEIKVDMVAEFSYDDDDEKADIHTESFAQIFPFLRQIICNITVSGGMPPLMIPIIRLDRDAVSVNDNVDDESRLS